MAVKKCISPNGENLLLFPSFPNHPCQVTSQLNWCCGLPKSVSFSGWGNFSALRNLLPCHIVRRNCKRQQNLRGLFILFSLSSSALQQRRCSCAYSKSFWSETLSSVTQLWCPTEDQIWLHGEWQNQERNVQKHLENRSIQYNYTVYSFWLYLEFQFPVAFFLSTTKVCVSNQNPLRPFLWHLSPAWFNPCLLARSAFLHCLLLEQRGVL